MIYIYIYICTSPAANSCVENPSFGSDHWEIIESGEERTIRGKTPRASNVGLWPITSRLQPVFSIRHGWYPLVIFHMTVENDPFIDDRWFIYDLSRNQRMAIFFWLKLDTFASLFRQRRSPHCRRIVGMPGALKFLHRRRARNARSERCAMLRNSILSYFYWFFGNIYRKLWVFTIK